MRFRLPFCLWLLALAGCAGPGQKTAHSAQNYPAEAAQTAQTLQADRYEIISAHTPFYKYGPAQAQGADFTLKKGVIVTLVKRSSGFSLVRIPEGEEGYVANERLAVAPPEPTPVHPMLRVDGDPEWLKVVPLDQMIEEPALPSGAGTNLNSPNLTNSQNGQHDHQ